jgi:hypothetical protein
MKPPPKSMRAAIATVDRTAGSPPSRGRGLTPPAAMTAPGTPLTPVARVNPTVERKVQRPMPPGFNGGQR